MRQLRVQGLSWFHLYQCNRTRSRHRCLQPTVRQQEQDWRSKHSTIPARGSRCRTVVINRSGRLPMSFELNHRLAWAAACWTSAVDMGSDAAGWTWRRYNQNASQLRDTFYNILHYCSPTTRRGRSYQFVVCIRKTTKKRSKDITRPYRHDHTLKVQ